MYVADLGRRGFGESHARTTLAAIAWFHKIENLRDTTKSFIVTRLLYAIRKGKVLARGKQPITRDLLYKILDLPASTQDKYQRIMLRAVFLLAYHACLRIGELCHSGSLTHTIMAEEIYLETQAPQRFIVRMKTFKLSKGPKTIAVPMGRDPLYCPVRALQMYLQMRPNVGGPLFLTSSGKPLERRVVSRVIKESVHRLGLNSDMYDTHSLRVGRATDLAQQGVPDHVIRETGRWNSNAYQKYLRFNIFSLPQ